MSLSEDLRRLADCKTNIKQAIQDKGVQVTSDRFEQYPEFIRTIDTDKWKSILIDTISIPPNEEYGIFNNEIAQLFEEGAIQRIAPYAFFYKSFDIHGMGEMNLRNIETIPRSAFEGCQNVPKIIGENVRKIEDNGFNGCSWKTCEVVFPQCTQLGQGVFTDCQNLTSITLNTENIIDSIGDSCFGGNPNLRRVDMVWGNSIPSRTFHGCPELEYIGDTNEVVDIGLLAFSGCTSMTHYHFPHCSHLDNLVFLHNTNLQVISFVGVDQVVEFYSSLDYLDSGELFSGNGDPEDPTEYSIIVPDSLYDEWIANEKWAKYADHIVKESEFGV